LSKLITKRCLLLFYFFHTTALLKFNEQWRHSSFGNYYIHGLEDKTTHPLIPPSHPPTISYVTWSPTGQSIAFVRKNDIYLLLSALYDVFFLYVYTWLNSICRPSEEPIQITDTGTVSFFNGVPDWVYEEEVFSSDFALFFSPSSTLLAYLTFDEADVDMFSFPIYNPTSDNFEVVPYTADVKMKYPKPGYNNPIVSLKVFDVSVYREALESPSLSSPTSAATLELDWEGRYEETDSIIQEVKWVGNNTLMIKEVNRNSDQGNVVLFELGDRGKAATRRMGKVVRKLGKDGEEGDNGWIDHASSLCGLRYLCLTKN
jgi:dipeptidyl aminopeptidase B